VKKTIKNSLIYDYVSRETKIFVSMLENQITEIVYIYTEISLKILTRLSGSCDFLLEPECFTK
jgi:hypothetical protein